jgi:NtrC-family two-component system sensor histidine kinase KinB
MTLSLRHRIFLTLLPLLVLLAVLGTAGVVLLNRLGWSIDAILRENYDSVVAMQNLNEAVERIDSAFQFALAGVQDKARQQYAANWKPYDHNLHVEENNITLPGEQELVDRLKALSVRYRRQGDAFFALQEDDPGRHSAYFGAGGLLETFTQIKGASNAILRLNQENMEQASREASRLSAESLVWFGVGLALALALAGLSAWHTVRTILRPIQAVTQAALGVSAGNLDQVVPSLSRDELGQLAQSFNTMTRHLRDYRQSHSARLLRAQRTSQATIDSFPDPVLVIDTEGGVEMANPAARHLFGVVPRDPDESFAPPWHPPATLEGPLRDALQRQTDYRPDGFQHAVSVGVGDAERFLLPRILAIRDRFGNTLGAAVLLQDVTRFRFLDQLKSDLVSTVSHELKTPLSSLRLDLHLVLEESLGPLSPQQLELLVDARDNAERLLAIVNNLLDLAGLEQKPGRLELRPAAPADLLRTAADGVRPRAADKGLELVLDVPDGLPEVDADSERLLHALGNLLDNAVTYTDRGGRVTLSAAASGGGVEFVVADTGVGIPPESLPHVFDRFFRVQGRSLGSGTGLGLAIVREIVAAHGGTVACQSTPGAGTTFRLTLPARAGAPGRGAADGTFAAAQHRLSGE